MNEVSGTVPASFANDLLAALRNRQPDMVADLASLVQCESPSDDLAATAACAEKLAELGTAYFGFAPTVHEVGGRRHLLWQGRGRPRVLVLGHYDTVWPLGTVEQRPFRVDGSRAYGPGIFDMKGGLVQLLHGLAEVGLDGIQVLMNGDEEIGSPTSSRLIEHLARQVPYALIAEASGPGGALKTSRKGMVRAELVLWGRAAHAGLEPDRGVSTTMALGPVIAAAAALGNEALATTVTPTMVRSGTVTNAIPDYASVAVDARAWSSAELDRVTGGLRALGSTATLTGYEVIEYYRREPLTEAASAELFALAQSLADGLECRGLAGAAVGGCSDGNLTAGVGAKTLDGLGAVGAGAHATGEYVEVDEMPRRAGLLAALASRLREA